MQKRRMGVSDERALWLATHVMPHEPAVRGWLRRGRQAEFDVDDIIQEAYAKLVTVADVSEIRNVRAYFFRTAYSVLVSRVRRKSVVSIRSLAEVESLQLAVDELTPEDTVMARNELQVLAEMISRLPEKNAKDIPFEPGFRAFAEGSFASDRDCGKHGRKTHRQGAGPVDGRLRQWRIWRGGRV